jgi:hypothetical protein
MMLRTLAAFTTAAALLYAPAALAVTGTQSITADVANTLEATFPGAYAWGDLTPGASGNTSSEQSVTVKSNASWGLKISTDLADGRMKEWNSTTGYVLVSPKVLTNALTYKLSALGGEAQSSAFAALSSTAALLTGSQGNTPDAGVAAGVTFKQVLSFADERAGSSNDYRVVVTYDAAQGY